MDPEADQQGLQQLGAAIQQLLQMAGPEWTMAAIMGLIEEVHASSQQAPQGAPPEVMSQGGPQAMPPMPGQNRGMMGRKLPPAGQRMV